MRRLFLLIFLTLFGLGIGLVVGAILMRRVDQTASRLAPENLLDEATRAATTARVRLRDAFAEGSRAAAETEAELRARYGVPTVEEAAREGRPPRRRG